MVMGFMDKIRGLAGLGGNVMYYPGCLTRFAAPELEERYEKILNKLGIDFLRVPEFRCCGSPVLNAGYDEDFYDLVKQNLEIFKRYGIRKIITNCPSCCKVFRNEYGLAAEHITETIAKNLDKIEASTCSEPISYHDPCHLGRGCGVYDAPRDIIRHKGCELVEMDERREFSLCCGAGGGYRVHDKGTSGDVARMRTMQCPTKRLVTACPMCYRHLKEHAPSSLSVYDMSEVVLW